MYHVHVSKQALIVQMVILSANRGFLLFTVIGPRDWCSALEHTTNPTQAMRLISIQQDT